MSESPFAPFAPSAPPLMTAEKARNIARSLYGLAQSYADSAMPDQATATFRQSEWWLAYAQTLAMTNEPPESEA